MIDRKVEPRLTQLEATTYWASFVAEHYLRHMAFYRARSRVEARLLERGFPQQGAFPIPKVDPQTISPRQFQKDYIRGYAPVVIKGIGCNWPAVQKWTPDFFKSRYGDEPLWVRVKSGAMDKEGVYSRDVTMRELIDNVLSGGEFYANNLEDLFNNHTELRDDLPLRDLEAYSRGNPRAVTPSHRKGWRLPRWGEIFSTQIFISSAKGRTGYHCASGGNFFLQVYGRKRWTFVNPRHTPFMYPAVRKDFLFSVSGIDCRMSGEELIQAGFPLYNFIPKYEVVLEPGDVLYSPQWWWHTVDNLAESIGVAMRFRTATFASNPVFSGLTVLSPALWQLMLRILRTGWGADSTAARRFFEREGTAIEDRASPSARASLAKAGEKH